MRPRRMADSSSLTAGFANGGQPTNSLPPSRTERSASAETPSAVADSPAKRYASADDRIIDRLAYLEQFCRAVIQREMAHTHEKKDTRGN